MGPLRVDPNVDFICDGSDTNPVIPAGDGGIDYNEGDPFLPDHWPIWSVVWEGYLDAPTDGAYAFRLHVNNGGWLEMKNASGQLETVVSCPGGSGFEGDCDGSRDLTAGMHYIRISYYNNAPSAANAIFSWQRPGDSAFSVVPTESLWTQAARFNSAPTVSLTCPSRVYVHDGATISGRFTDPDPGETWTATYDGFNQAGPAPLLLNSDQTFELGVEKPILGAGTFNVVIAVTDNAGAAGEARCTIVAVPKRVMLYVHGTTGSFRQDASDPRGNDFPSLFGRLVAGYPVRFYRYYEDAGDRDPNDATFACLPGTRRAIPAIDPSAEMPVDLTGDDPYPGTCDSNDDVELNAVRLDADLQDLANDFDNVTLLSNSGGARIVRTYLAYAKASNSPSLDLVDLVVSLEGVQQGTYLAAVVEGLDQAVDGDPERAQVRDTLLDRVKPLIRHDPRRPLFQDVIPASQDIQYTNTGVTLPDGVHYVNVDGDIRIHIIESFFLIPVEEPQVYSVGDVVILPGSDDPRDLPDRGGARFLPSSAAMGASSDEWELTRDYDLHYDPTAPGLLVGGWELSDLLGAPEAHVNLGSMLDRMCVQGQGRRHLDEVLFRQIASLDSGAPEPGILGLGRGSEVSCP